MDSNSLNEAVTSAMQCTLQQLVKDKLIADEVAQEFFNTHAVMMITKDSFLRKWAEDMGWFKSLKDPYNSLPVCITLPK